MRTGGPIDSVRQAFRQAITLLSPSARRQYWLVVCAQMSASVLDLIGVMLVGLVGLLAAASLQGSEVPAQVQSVMDHLGLTKINATSTTIAVAVVAAGFLLAKTLLSGYLSYRIFRFLGFRQADVSTEITAALLKQPLVKLEKRSSQETAYAVGTAVSSAVTSVLGASAQLMAELSLLLLLSVGLLVLDPLVTVAAFAFFATIGFVLHRVLSRWSSHTGSVLGATTIMGQRRLQDALATYRELTVLGRREEIVRTLSRNWGAAGAARSVSLFTNQVPRLVYDAALIAGAACLAAWQYGVSSPVQATATLAVFLAAGSRILPSMLRLNTLSLNIRYAAAEAQVLYPLISDLGELRRPEAAVEASSTGIELFTPAIDLVDVSVTYPGMDAAALRHVNLSIRSGARVALVGPTGAGKSTLADVILGVLPPDEGVVRISGLCPLDAVANWPGSIAYVPQAVSLINGTVRENVALGIDPAEVDDDRVWSVLRQAHLADYLVDGREGLDTLVGDRGAALSGGQRQRLGLARAMYSEPSLIVLDEATSALDSETEHLVSQTLSNLPSSVTTVTIAHRLATIRESDAVVYLEDGVVIFQGTFDDVRAAVPAFDRQAANLGL